MIYFQDEGIGLSNEQMKKLFQDNKEYVSRPGTLNEKGSGLGLMISKDFVHLNGGEIGVLSKVDEGSEFWFHVPSVS